jgi:hypothetical protein
MPLMYNPFHICSGKSLAFRSQKVTIQLSLFRIESIAQQSEKSNRNLVAFPFKKKKPTIRRMPFASVYSESAKISFYSSRTFVWYNKAIKCDMLPRRSLKFAPDSIRTCPRFAGDWTSILILVFNERRYAILIKMSPIFFSKCETDKKNQKFN